MGTIGWIGWIGRIGMIGRIGETVIGEIGRPDRADRTEASDLGRQDGTVRIDQPVARCEVWPWAGGMTAGRGIGRPAGDVASGALHDAAHGSGSELRARLADEGGDARQLRRGGRRPADRRPAIVGCRLVPIREGTAGGEVDVDLVSGLERKHDVGSPGSMPTRPVTSGTFRPG